MLIALGLQPILAHQADLGRVIAASDLFTIDTSKALSLIFCYVAVAFMAGSLGIFFSSVFRRSTVSTAVTYGTLIAFVAGTYFINRFALSMSAANLDQTIAAYAMEAPAIRASSGGAFYLFLMNPAFTFMAVIGNQAGRSTSFASVCSYFGMENTGFVMEHWVLLSVLLQLVTAPSSLGGSAVSGACEEERKKKK